MSFDGRSLDDLPLAAYTTGGVPDEDEPLEPEADPDLVAPPALTQRDLAAALVEPVVPSTPPEAKKARGPRPSLKLPSPKLPSLRRSKAAALQAAAPFQPVAAAAGPAAAAASFQAVTASAPPAPPFKRAAPFQAAPAFEQVQRPGAIPPLPAPPNERAKGAPRAGGSRVPRFALRDPRVLAGGVIVVGLGFLGLSLLGGGGPASGSTGPNGSQNPAAFLATAAPGNASVEVTSSPAGIHALTSATGAGAAVNSQLDATWTGASGESLGINGAASQGTRTTDPTFFLSWTMQIDDHSVTFTSRAAECTIGMAVGVKAVHGTFVCKNLKSGDGRYRIDMRGEYTT